MTLKADVAALAAQGKFGEALDLLVTNIADVDPTTDETYSAGHGPVVHDSSDGHTYRLGTTAGAVVATEVT